MKKKIHVQAIRIAAYGHLGSSEKIEIEVEFENLADLLIDVNPNEAVGHYGAPALLDEIGQEEAETYFAGGDEEM